MAYIKLDTFGIWHRKTWWVAPPKGWKSWDDALHLRNPFGTLVLRHARVIPRVASRCLPVFYMQWEIPEFNLGMWPTSYWRVGQEERTVMLWSTTSSLVDKVRPCILHAPRKKWFITATHNWFDPALLGGISHNILRSVNLHPLPWGSAFIRQKGCFRELWIVNLPLSSPARQS